MITLTLYMNRKLHSILRIHSATISKTHLVLSFEHEIFGHVWQLLVTNRMLVSQQQEHSITEKMQNISEALSHRTKHR